MDPRKLHKEYGLDLRLEYQGCAFCGGSPTTTDHVPSKAFLSKPYPDNFPQVPACKECNQSFSMDEQYVTCLLDCVICGSSESPNLSDTTQKTFRRSPALAERIERCRFKNEKGDVVWAAEMDRVENVITKLARGHVLFDLSYHELETPSTISCMPLMAMSDGQLTSFENAGVGQLTSCPGEIGSRAFLRAFGEPGYAKDEGPWVTVQPGRYRYAIENGWVQIVIAEYLACFVEW
ncbi:MAG: hypothetical protein HOP17_13880 [Acidobacteria bacterium]|nr:hypothetical protein [Acidobacteriota bacterium]